MSLLVNALLVVAFTVLARAMLAARQVSWLRLLVAAIVGLVVGFLISAFIVFGADGWAVARAGLLAGRLSLAGDPAVWVLALPLQLLVTMAMVVAFELISSRPRRRFRLRPLNPLAALRRRLAIMGRFLQVSRVAARRGLAQRGREPQGADSGDSARRLRAAIEDLGGVYVKLGQLLATRPDLVPDEVIAELSKLHSSIKPLPMDQVESVLRDEIGEPRLAFASLEGEPLGSASIGQVHGAVLRDGTQVVVKVQRPGLELLVERDLAVLDWVSRSAERRSAAARTYGANRLVADFAQAMREELDFRNEAAHMASFAAAVATFPLIHVPRAYPRFTTERVLVMERLIGTPLSAGLAEPPANGRELADALCDAQIRAMLRGERFHGDPHPGNVLLLTDGRLGVIDLGMTGKLDAFGRAFVLELLTALRLQDPTLMYEALLTGRSVELGADRDTIERALASYMSAHIGAKMLSGQAMTDLVRVTADLGIALPDQASLTFRAVGTLVGTLEILSPGYPLVERLSSAAGVEIRSRITPKSGSELLQRELATLAPFIRRAPRHVDLIASLLEHGQLTARVSLLSQAHDVAVLERLLNRVLLVVLGVGVLATSVLMLGTQTGPVVGFAGFYLTQLFGWFGMFIGTVLVLRALIEVLRPVRDPVRADGRQSNAR